MDWDFEIGVDSTGDPALWIWVFVDDTTASREDFPALATEIEKNIRNALAAAEIMRWPYVLFRTAAEQRAL